MSTLILFFNSNFFIGFITLIVSTVAFRVYSRQKADAKRDAANVILLEIQNAEKQLGIINQNRDANILDENIYLMKNSSWDTYRYFFVRDFDTSEWEKITTFYNKCIQYDKAVTGYNENWASNVKSAQKHVLRILADYADLFTQQLATVTPRQKEKIRKDYEDKKTAFISSYGVIQNDDNYPAPYFYSPQKPILEAKVILDTIETALSTSSVGVKLKTMSDNANLLKRIRLVMSK
jgi:hypothetical protein